MPADARGLARLALGRFGRLRWLLDSDQTQTQRGAGLAADPNWSIDQSPCRMPCGTRREDRPVCRQHRANAHSSSPHAPGCRRRHQELSPCDQAADRLDRRCGFPPPQPESGSASRLPAGQSARGSRSVRSADQRRYGCATTCFSSWRAFPPSAPSWHQRCGSIAPGSQAAPRPPTHGRPAWKANPRTGAGDRATTRWRYRQARSRRPRQRSTSNPVRQGNRPRSCEADRPRLPPLARAERLSFPARSPRSPPLRQASERRSANPELQAIRVSSHAGITYDSSAQSLF